MRCMGLAPSACTTAGGVCSPPAPSPSTYHTHPAGVGLDFNTQLVEAIGKVKGANYYSVHSPGEFRRRLVDDFDYAVS